MNKKVLIVGNGISRQKHQDFIQNWKDEIWACNSAYLEFYNGQLPRLDIIIGDYKALIEIVPYKQKYGGKYKIFSKNHKGTDLPGVEVVDLNRKFIADSGSTLVARALDKNYEEIYVVGFDLGGKDIYVKGHEDRNKEKWIRNWRKIAGTWGLDKVQFIGYDHKPYILSDIESTKYAELYMNGHDHIEYLQSQSLSSTIKKSEVLILGNGKSRENESVKKRIKEWTGEIWVCNHAYKESLHRIDRVGTVHNDLAEDIINYKEKNQLSYDVYIRDPMQNEEYKNKIKYFRDKRGWSTGNLMIIQAILDEYKFIVLAGYDLGGPDIYQDSDRPDGGFKKQFKAILKEFGHKNISFWGNQPEDII